VDKPKKKKKGIVTARGKENEELFQRLCPKIAALYNKK